MTYQLGELDRAALVAGEDEELTARRGGAGQRRAHRAVVRRKLRVAVRAGRRHPGRAGAGVAPSRGAGGHRLRSSRPYLEARDGIKSQLEDLALFLRRYADGVEASPAALQHVEDRLALLERIKRKCRTLARAMRSRAAKRCAAICAISREATTGSGAESRASSRPGRRISLSATELSTARQRAAKACAVACRRCLAELAMEQTRIELRFAAEPMAETEWSGRGIDTAEFFVSPNPARNFGHSPESCPAANCRGSCWRSRRSSPRPDAASARRSDRPPSESAPGLIFDEVDAGIGGRVADIVGRRLRGLGSAFQVLCITHLPQIAAYADTHFQIEKRVSGGRTQTTVVRLDEAGRIEELSRMLGGTTVTDWSPSAPPVRCLASRLRPSGEPVRRGGPERLGDACDQDRAKAKGERRKSRTETESVN